jgi:hypothetical protein
MRIDWWAKFAQTHLFETFLQSFSHAHNRRKFKGGLHWQFAFILITCVVNYISANLHIIALTHKKN